MRKIDQFIPTIAAKTAKNQNLEELILNIEKKFSIDPWFDDSRVDQPNCNYRKNPSNKIEE